MKPEKLAAKTPAVDRIATMLYGPATVANHALGREMSCILNQERQETISAAYYNTENGRKLILCTLRQKGNLVLEFSVGQDGLEHIGSRELRVSFGDSKSVKIGPVGLGTQGSFDGVTVSDDVKKEFANLADNVADWMEKIFHDGKIGEVPFIISTK
jgi:hypothetical protein